MGRAVGRTVGRGGYHALGDEDPLSQDLLPSSGFQWNLESELGMEDTRRQAKRRGRGGSVRSRTVPPGLLLYR